MNLQHSSRIRRGQAMIGLLVTVAIIIAVAGIYLSQKGKNPDGSESSHTALRRSIDLAKEVELQSNLSQIQQIIGMYKGDNDGKVPPSLDDLKKYAKFPNEMWVNPVDKKPLGYDPATGLIIVEPYEGESPNIARMTANPNRGSDQPVTPGAAPAPPAPGAAPPPAPAPSDPGIPGGPPMPKMPVIPNSSSDPNAGAE